MRAHPLAKCPRLVDLFLASLLTLLAGSGCSPQESAQQNRQAEIHHKQAVTFFRVAQFDAAISSAEKALLSNPIHKRTLKLLAKLYIVLGRYDDAVALLESAGIFPSNDIALTLLHLEALIHSGNPSVATQRLEANAANWLQYPAERDWIKAQILEAQGLYKQAHTQYLTIFGEHNYLPAKLGYLRTAVVTQNCNILDEYIAAPQGDGTQQQVKVFAAQCLLLESEFEKAAEILTEVLAQSKKGDRLTVERAALLLNISDALKKINRIPEAMVYTELVEQESDDSQNDAKILGLVSDLIAQGKRNQAAIIFKEIQHFESKLDAIEARVGQYFYNKGQLARAALWLNQANAQPI